MGTTVLEREIRIERDMPARPEILWAALTEARELETWWGPEGWTAPAAEVEPHKGGSFSVLMKGPELPGTWMRGSILEIDPPRRLVLDTSAEAPDGNPGVESQAMLDIARAGEGSQLVLVAKARGLSPQAAPMLAGMRAGWSQSLQKLEDRLAGRAGRQLVVQAFVPAPPEKVWEAWSEIGTLGRWWGPEGFSLTNEHFDFREAGEWRFVMHGPDGSNYEQKLLYTELVPGERLRYRHLLANFEATVTFDEVFGNTALTMRLVFPGPAELARSVETYHADEGAAQTLARLCALFSG